MILYCMAIDESINFAFVLWLIARVIPSIDFAILYAAFSAASAAFWNLTPTGREREGLWTSMFPICAVETSSVRAVLALPWSKLSGELSLPLVAINTDVGGEHSELPPTLFENFGCFANKSIASTDLMGAAGFFWPALSIFAFRSRYSVMMLAFVSSSFSPDGMLAL